ncbi:MAG: PQQ-dependent sugar dehydrogenase [Myxococcaceae bacterium]
MRCFRRLAFARWVIPLAALVACEGILTPGNGEVDPDAVGLDVRPTNLTCTAFARPPSATGGGVTLAPAFPNMQFENGGQGVAIGLIRSRLGPNSPWRWFVVERDGDIWTFVDANASKTGLAVDGTTAVEQARLFFDLPVNVSIGGEAGLLAVAFDPEFHLRDDRNYIYLHYTTFPQNNVWRFRVMPDGNGGFVASDATEIFVTLSGGSNHWGGDMKFGPDGYLYLALGDGGNGMAAAGAQSLGRTRGKILRFDPRGGSPYAIPATNPYRANGSGTPYSLCNGAIDLTSRADPCPEVWSYGFRNPWRFSFDRQTGDLWVGDVGTQREEVNLVRSGENYGWPNCDGVLPTNACPPTQAGTAFIAPIAQFRQGSTVSVTGGYVYRGAELGTGYQGNYVFSEVYAGDILRILQPQQFVSTGPFRVTNTYEHPSESGFAILPRFTQVAGLSAPFLVSFAEDENGELYVVTFSGTVGQAIFRLTSQSAPPVDTVPAFLSQTGCVADNNPTQPASGLIPYALNAPFWSDGAEKYRWMALPEGARIQLEADGDFSFPTGAVLVKEFRLGGQRIETRLFVRHSDGGWAGYSYVWDDAQTNARKANAQGEDRVVGGQVWHYPSRAECLGCHTAPAGGTIGLETRQLARAMDYPNGRGADQLRTLNHIGLFTTALDRQAVTPFVDPFGSASVESRARTYLHSNCASCHRAGGELPNLHFDVSLTSTGLCGTHPFLARIASTDPVFRMPKGVRVPDAAGVSLLESWAATLGACP